MNLNQLESMPYTLTAAQLAEVLGINKNTAYQLMHSEGFPTLRIGRRMMVQKDKLLLWMDKNTAPILANPAVMQYNELGKKQ